MPNQQDATVAKLYQESYSVRADHVLLDYADALIEIAGIYEDSGYDYPATLEIIESRILRLQSKVMINKSGTLMHARDTFRKVWTAPDQCLCDVDQRRRDRA
jgi:hypothetical protein